MIHDQFSAVVYALLALSLGGDVTCAVLQRPALAQAPRVFPQPWILRYVTFYLLLAVVAIIDVRFALLVTSRTLLSAAANASRVWVLRAVGPAEYAAQLSLIARQSTKSAAMGGLFASSGLYIALGVLLCWVGPSWYSTPAGWIGAGIVVYGAQLLFAGSHLYGRLFQHDGSERIDSEPPN